MFRCKIGQCALSAYRFLAPLGLARPSVDLYFPVGLETVGLERCFTLSSPRLADLPRPSLVAAPDRTFFLASPSGMITSAVAQGSYLRRRCMYREWIETEWMRGRRFFVELHHPQGSANGWRTEWQLARYYRPLKMRRLVYSIRQRTFPQAEHVVVCEQDSSTSWMQSSAQQSGVS